MTFHMTPTRLVKCLQALYKDTLVALQELLKSVLAKDPTPDGLQSVFKVKSGVSGSLLSTQEEETVIFTRLKVSCQ